MVTKVKSKKTSGDSKEHKLGQGHVKVPLDHKNMLKMHISHAIMQGLLKVK